MEVRDLILALEKYRDDLQVYTYGHGTSGEPTSGPLNKDLFHIKNGRLYLDIDVRHEGQNGRD